MADERNGIDLLSPAGLKALLAEEDGIIKEAHFSGAGGDEIVRRRTSLIDRVLRGIHRRFSADPSLPALIAVGGYGRGELNPYSDIDILLLAKNERDRERASPLLYALWDAGLDIGYSVRTMEECVDLAREDIKIRTSLMESRPLAGDPDLYEAFQQSLHDEVFFRKPAQFIAEKLAERQAIRLKYGGSVYLREPNLKESAGGLRDFHTARWIAFVGLQSVSFTDLLSQEIVTPGHLAVFLRSRNFLWRIRNELHYLTKRKNDHLTFDLQDTTARDFRFRDSAHLLSVERFMKAYFIHARNILEFSRIVTERTLPPRRRGWFERTRQAGSFLIMGKTLLPQSDDLFRKDPSRVFDAFALRQEQGLLFSDHLHALIAAHRFGAEVRESAEASRKFLAILDTPRNLADTLVQMKESKVLGRYLPEFRAIQSLARHDYHHTYTVDEHILTAVRNLENVWEGRYPGLMTLFEAFRQIEKRWVLILAVLLHDLGKVYREHHEIRGVDIAGEILDRLGIGGKDQERILLLVEHHLLMATLSQRRELSDGSVVADFAATVGDRENLNLLYLLTYADLSAVSPTAWSAWKATLLQDLYLRTAEYFERKGAAEEAARVRIAAVAKRLREACRDKFTERELDAFLQAMPDSYLLTASLGRMAYHLELIRKLPQDLPVITHRHRPDRGYTELTVCAFDAYGMFFRTAGAIAAQNLNIIRAQVFTTRNGVMIDTFQISDPEGNIVLDEEIWKTTVAELKEILRFGKKPQESHLSAYLRKSHGTVEPSVEFDNAASAGCTIIDITARDRVGLLYKITQALYDLNLDIASAKIVTEGIRVMDSFYVTDLLREKILDPARLKKIEDVLRGVLE